MEECELCGRKANDIYLVNIEGAELRVCVNCAQGKKIVATYIQKTEQKGKSFASTRPPREEDQRLVENFGTVIREARDRMHLPLKVLAEMIAEKETFLARVEHQSTMPSIALTKKLEKALNIKLIDMTSDTGGQNRSSGNTEAPSLGDFIKRKGKQENEEG
ncbi:MAG TPA: multiprotein bridging factor aMBF1 [Candidatus Acidoferrales bacterium]|nr:multiprotein bridging factor aMBF1 [Candidatus Acidoferrales bacterium]